MNHKAKMILSEDLEHQIKEILCPMDELKKHVGVDPFHDEKYLHESKIIYVTFLFMTEGGSTSMVQKHQLDEMEELGFHFVSVDSTSWGMKMTFNKQNKFTTI